MAETKDVIATNLRTLRKVRGLSQPELAAQVGISPRTLARLEAGEVADPSINHVRALSRALGVTVDLLSESELRPITIAVPAELCATLDTPEGLAMLAELVHFERARAQKAGLRPVRELAGEREEP